MNDSRSGSRPVTRYAATIAIVVGLLGGCSGTPSDSSSSPTAEPTGSATGSPTATATASTTAAPVEDPIASETKEPIDRGAGAGAARVEAEPAAEILSTVEYDDGLQVAITDASRATTSGEGPGEITGQEYVLLEVEVTNSSETAVDTSNVIVEATYGDPARVARSVYTDKTTDLAGVLEPGKSGTATYGFVLPPADLGLVTMTFDIDGAHGLAQFSGEIP